MEQPTLVRRALLGIAVVAVLSLAGCNGNAPVTAAEEQGFKHPSKNPPPGFTTPPPMNPQKPAAAGG